MPVALVGGAVPAVALRCAPVVAVNLVGVVVLDVLHSVCKAATSCAAPASDRRGRVKGRMTVWASLDLLEGGLDVLGGDWRSLARAAADSA